jgi:DNA repair protein RadC
MKKIKSLPFHERPWEKLQQKGAKSLSDLELLAILLGSGTKNSDVMVLAGRILKVLDKTSTNPSLEDLQSIGGVEPVKATLIAAAIEFARRRIRIQTAQIPFRG